MYPLSLNGIKVRIRRRHRRHEMIFEKISHKVLELATSTFTTMYPSISIYMSIESDVTIYFRSEANCLNVLILGGHTRVAISR